MNFYSYVDDPNGWVDIFGLAKSYISKRKTYNLRNRGELSEFKDKQGVYIHYFQTPNGIRTYTGQATDMGTRPKISLREVTSGKGGNMQEYMGTKVKVARQTLTDTELNEIENKYLTKNGGHRSPKTYNSRAVPGFG